MKNQRMYDELIELITTDSVSRKESAVAELLVKKLSDLGFSIHRDKAGDTFGGECGNIFAVLEGALDGSVLFSSHMDRVPNGLGIRPMAKDGILYSDGTTILAADDVSGICAILEGIRLALEAGAPLPRIEILFTVGEEIGLFGALAMDMSLIRSKIAYVFDSPGPVGRLIHAAPGMYHLSCQITGRAAHAGNEPEKGIDAAKLMCDMLSSLRQGRLDEITTSNFPILSTGSASSNVVCDSASFSGEARSRSAERLENYVAYFERHCTELAKERGAGIKIQKNRLFQAFCIPETDPCILYAREALASLGIPCLIEAGGGGMDGNIYNERGLTAIGVATGYTKNHTKEEQLVLDDFFRSGQVAAAILFAYAKTCPAK